MNNLITKADFENFRNRLANNRIGAVKIRGGFLLDKPKQTDIEYNESENQVRIVIDHGSHAFVTATEDIIDLIENEDEFIIMQKNDCYVRFSKKQNSDEE